MSYIGLSFVCSIARPSRAKRPGPRASAGSTASEAVERPRAPADTPPMPPPEREEPTQLGTNPALGHVGPYALIDTLGKGGMARVYLARHTGTGSLYALKRPHPDMRNDPGIRGRFEREVEIGRRLKHPGIPRLIEADTAADWPYAVFELVPGLNLEQLNRILAENGRLLPYPVTMSLLCRALEALDAAHRLDIVHRDLSPRNLMLSFDGTVRVIDFGAAKAEVGEFKTRPGTAMGSIHYASPEYFRGEGVGASADIYAMAAIAYELLSGRPVVGRVENMLHAAQVVAEVVPAQIHSVNPEVPLEISLLIARSLSKDPAQRPASANALAQALIAIRPEWCSLSAEAIRRFLEAWFPAEAAALQRFLASKSEGPIEEEVLHTVLAPTSVVEARTIAAPQNFAAEVESGLGVRFPVVPRATMSAAPRSRSEGRFGLATIVGTGLISAAVAGLAVAVVLRQAREPAPVATPAPEARILAAPSLDVDSTAASPTAAPSLSVAASPIAAAPSVAALPIATAPSPAASPPASALVRGPSVHLAKASARPAVLAPPSATPSPEKQTHRDPALAKFARQLEVSTVDNLARDPAFPLFVERATELAGQLTGEAKTKATRNIAKLQAAPSVERVRAVLELASPAD